MPIKYLCIDDDKESVLPLLDAIKNGSDDLEFECQKPKSEIRDQITSIKASSSNGYIIDFRLDKNKNDENEIVYHRGHTLAQELRTRMAERSISSSPIVLWTVDDFQQSSKKDDTSRDLYDRVYIKDKDILNNPQVVKNELVSLAQGYISIKEKKNGPDPFFSMLGISVGEDDASLDPRMGESLRTQGRLHSCHKYAQYILKNLVLVAGPLVDDRILAARFGIDKSQSEDWRKLLDKISTESKYNGVFCEAWPRWWMHRVENWWKSCKPSPPPLRRLTAEERVDIIKKSTKLTKLVAAIPYKRNYSSRFWTICQVYECPLDPIDGFMAFSPNPLPWQDTPYLSMHSVLEREHKKKNFSINPLERQRLKSLKRI